METVVNIWNQVNTYIDATYLCIFMLLGYLIKEYLRQIICDFFHKDIPFVFIILALATIVAVPFLFTGSPWQKILFSYAIGTSLHEVAFTFIERKMKALLGTGPENILYTGKVEEVAIVANETKENAQKNIEDRIKEINGLNEEPLQHHPI
jgi:hypothetical protein